jgi:hypothetical protein
VSARLTPYFFLVTRKDGWAERCIFYAAGKSQAMQYARVWARRLGYTIEEADA